MTYIINISHYHLSQIIWTLFFSSSFLSFLVSFVFPHKCYSSSHHMAFVCCHMLDQVFHSKITVCCLPIGPFHQYFRVLVFLCLGVSLLYSPNTKKSSRWNEQNPFGDGSQFLHKLKMQACKPQDCTPTGSDAEAFLILVRQLSTSLF